MSYPLPPEGALEGKVLDASGTASATLDLDDASNWHIGLGAEDPGQRIRARALSLFDADAYLLLDLHSELPPPRASIGGAEGFELHAWPACRSTRRMAGEAEVSWAPSHLSGQLGFTGGVLAAGLRRRTRAAGQPRPFAAETPTPFQIELDASVDVGLPWPLGRPDHPGAPGTAPGGRAGRGHAAPALGLVPGPGETPRVARAAAHP